MELRQLRYFIRIIELGSMGQAARDLGVVQSTLSQQISRLESELCTRLLHRTPNGVAATEAGAAFLQEARLTIRHAEQAVRVAQQARLSGTVSVGLAPTTAAMLALPLIQAMKEQYPSIRLHLVESMSGHLSTMLTTRELDLAILFDNRQQPYANLSPRQRLESIPLLIEDLFLISAQSTQHFASGAITISQIGDIPLILPTDPHGLRTAIDAAFTRTKKAPNIAWEIDSLSMVMSAVEAGLGATLQPYAALGHYANAQERFSVTHIEDPQVYRLNALCSIPENELSPAALATRIVMRNVVQSLVTTHKWRGARLWHQSL